MAQPATVKLLTDAVATGAGTSYNSSQLVTKTFQAVIATTATVQFQGSVDGVNWSSIGAALTATGTVNDSDAWPLVRANVTAWTAGTVNCWLFGQG